MKIPLLLFAFTFIHLVAAAQSGSSQNSSDTILLTWQGKVKKKTRQGEWRGFDDKGKVQAIAVYNKGVPEGKWELYYPNGILRERGTYVQGKRHGKWEEFTLKGHLLVEGEYINGKQEGVWTYHSMWGSGYTKRSYVHDTLHGMQQEYYKGNLQEEMMYVKGKRNGAHTLYFNTGKLAEQSWYVNDTLEGPHFTLKANGDTIITGTYMHGEKTGLWVTREDGIVTERMWYGTPVLRENKRRDAKGKTRTRIAYAQVIDSSHTYKNGKIITRGIYDTSRTAPLERRGGTFINYNAHTGAVEQICIKTHFTFDCTVYDYDETGRPVYVVSVGNNNMLHGPAIWYHNNGVVRAKDTLENGHISEGFILYDRKGKVIPSTSPKYRMMLDSVYLLTPKLLPPHEGPLYADEQITEYTQDGSDEGYDDATTEIIETPADENEVFTFVEEMPSFPGDAAAFSNYLKQNLQYPQAEKDAGVSGTVYMYFVVNTDGSISDIRTVKAVNDHPAFATEAKRVLSQMPNWNPGKMNGKPVRVGMTVPVRFVVE